MMTINPEFLHPFVKDTIYLAEYPIHFAGCSFHARMTIIRLKDGSLWVHSPCELSEPQIAEISAIGPVRYLIGPGNYHWLHLKKAQEYFPKAETYICPGIERKAPSLMFDWILGDRSPAEWKDEIDQVLVRGTRFIWEVAFFHRASKTLILTDLVENIGDATPGIGWLLTFWWKIVFHMWNNPKPAPEYQMGWKDKRAARVSLEKILHWDFDKIILSHGELITANAQNTLHKAWHKPHVISH